MAMFTQSEANAVLAATINGSAYTTSSSYLTPTTSQGSATAAGTELSSSSGRQLWTLTTPITGGAAANAATITWTNMSAGTVVAVDSYSAATAGTRKHYGALTTSRTVASGDQLQIAAGALTVSLV